MKRLLLFASLIFSAVAYAGTFEMDDDGTTTINPAYHGAKSQALTAVRTTVDMRGDLNYSVYCAGAAQERFMFGSYTTTARRAPYIATTVPATTWHGGAVNKNTPFGNFSGCAGFLRRQ